MGIKVKDIFNLNTYHYDLPPELIAQYPTKIRDASRLLLLERSSGKVSDRMFFNIIDYLETGDTLVLNETRVMPSRLYGRKETGARVELLLLRKREEMWEALAKPARRLSPGTLIKFDGFPEVGVEIVEIMANMEGGRLIKFVNCPHEDDFINQVGHIPLPPYIERGDEKADYERYQTIYARETGSAAAPTAGLHFTGELLEKIAGKGVNIAFILLHVGLGTFRPVKQQDIRKHQMHYEHYEVNQETAQLLNETRKKGRRIIAVGTTAVRTLETVYLPETGFCAQKGETDKFIYPGYEIRAVDSLISNFHLPGSTLLMLVAAFAGIEHTMAAYRHAVQEKYRFFSYGDAMLII